VNRRAFIASGVSLLATPFAADAQQTGKIWQIGYLSPAEGYNPIDQAFERSMKNLGYVDGQNIRLERRYSRGQSGAFQPLATELVGLGVDLLVAWSPGGAFAAQRATSQRPVVFLAVGDPVATGLVSSMARPGSNLTGISSDASLDILPKGLQLLKEAIPGLRRVALLAPVDDYVAQTHKRMITAAKEQGLDLEAILVTAATDLGAAVRDAKNHGAEALQIFPSGLMYSSRKQLDDLALMYRLPSIHSFREAVLAGGLLSYAPSLTGIAERAAIYVDKIIKGANPAELPVEQPTKFELVINLKTAKALGLTIPQSLLGRADEVIQ